MFRHICQPCKLGSHDLCWKVKHPPKRDGQIVLGGSMCVCKDPSHNTLPPVNDKKQEAA